MGIVKIIARQVPPDRQMSPMWMWGEDDLFTDEKIMIAGNDRLTGKNRELYDSILDRADEAAEEIRKFEEGAFRNYETVRDILDDTFYDFLFVDDKSVEELVNIIKGDFDPKNPQEFVVDMMTILTKEDYDYKTIRGCCQSEWNYIIYPVRQEKWIDQIEKEYFNTGTEFEIMIIDEERYDSGGYFNERGEFNINMFDWDEHQYCYTENYRDEIAENHMVGKCQVIAYGFDDYIRTPKYKLIRE